ncbi:MAG: LacI family DNA-binding transcriptional regulator [Alphaproteobacteria bacterium]
MKNGKPTIKDVARLAGVSPMTASRVANGQGNVRAEKREAVLRAMRTLDYAPHAAAQSMRTQRTRRIGFMLPDITNMTNAVVSLAVERHLARDRYHLMLFNTDFQTAIERDVLAMGNHKMFDGLIAALADDTDPSVAAALAASPIPVVLIDRQCGVAVDCVYSDHHGAMRTIVQQLAHLGHRRIALIAPSRAIWPGRARVEAFVEAMAGCDLPVDRALIWAEDQSIAFGRQVTLAMMASADPPTALIAGANQLTLGAYQALRDSGIAIPGDVSFVGADDPYLASLMSPPVTVIYRDMELVGRHAADLLLRRLRGEAGPSPRSVTVPSEIALRDSTGPARRRR